MTEDEAVEQLKMLARSRAFGRHVGSDRLIKVALDALLADVDTPSLPLPAGLGRREEPEASGLFDQVMEELGFVFEPPADPTAARWELAYWLADQIADGSLNPATGADMVWTEAAMELRYPPELQPIVTCAIQLDDWNEDWTISRDEITSNVVRAAHELLRNRASSAPRH
ncbi:hypothetical protein [Streptomyces sp. MI02-7b]|uniref:hypothetical protein n=1 Tax=Streptomyces sp. MI02-7b TaxID=462941 RepID=UPI0029A96EF9|nr:hypothetical protein [Streptomyces sp. MI02-7b]MDX3076104.1 hypothetical protein [Streptomyces sp. MI02-7b]